ncbi:MULTISPECIES: hypothetical protein [Planktothrix]|jgi:hypothetical protein|uniref:Uncharacterized protein n=2 Tax=Planktothrix TaxID=54304 RepID=A0A4P5ZBL2_PLAAG|nr:MULTISPECIES: hypothetical protein [Planktothrix]CAD5929900.1 hypothetical protein NO108_01600 [Planktothrix rubescens]CAC5340900.1 hypothetical protein PLAN_120125 [Planktothrix rubescens NIVA-CYA 18]CAD0219532.1 conserved hypothetical protein [Planktothrix agardhii]CAD5936998.1 hypothetical protein PCC7821_01656 [Planktothrix rubescens NIVA-CYA 18]CAD5938824.1 hypothetical protein NO758_01770 [Planktothrix agardhii]
MILKGGEPGAKVREIQGQLEQFGYNIVLNLTLSGLTQMRYA